MTDQPEHPEGHASKQDQSLEAQLDALLNDLEAAEPEMVPADLRKQQAKTPTPKPADESPAEKSPSPETIASMASGMLDQQIEDTIARAEHQQPRTPPAEPEPVSQAGEQKATPATPAKKGMDLESIASMASNLLDKQIEDMVAETTKPSPVEAEAEQPDAPADEPGKHGKSLSEDELGAQIQALLNNVQQQPDAGDTGSQQTPQPQDTPEDLPETAPVPVQASDESGRATEAFSSDSSDAGAVSIEQIDAMLAESAEQAIEREPEPVDEVPGTDEILAAQALEEDAQQQAQEQPIAPPRVETKKPEPAPEPAPQPAATPQPVGATASDVADELDEDAMPAPAAATPARAYQPDPDDAFEPAAVVIHESALKKAEQRLLFICGKINRPLNRLSPEMKDTVGWVGVVTLGFSLVVILYGLVF